MNQGQNQNQEATRMLWEGLMEGNIDMVRVREALVLGANINATNNDGITPLHIAASDNSPDLVRLLIENGANINATDIFSETPLHASVDGNCPDIVRLLIENGADVNAIDLFGKTPLHASINGNCSDIVRLLIENGADVNAIDYSGDSPLSLVINNSGNLCITKLLIYAGADVNASELLTLEHVNEVDLARLSPSATNYPMDLLIRDISTIQPADHYNAEISLRSTLAKVILRSLKEISFKIENQQSLDVMDVNILSIFKDADTPEKLLPQKIKDKFKFYSNTDSTKDIIKHFISIAFKNNCLLSEVLIEDLIASFLVETSDQKTVTKDRLENINFTISFFSKIENITESLHESGAIGDNMRVEDVESDGNCFFHAVSRFTAMDHQELRTRASNYLFENIEQYRGYIHNMSVDEYIIQNTQANIWADHLIIQALADSLPNYRFEIIRSNGDRNIIESRNIEDNPTTIRLYYTGNHYMAIVQDPEELIDTEVIEAEDNMEEVENQIIEDYTNNIDNDVVDVLGEQFQI